jgi:hypothetical protein
LGLESDVLALGKHRAGGAYGLDTMKHSASNPGFGLAAGDRHHSISNWFSFLHDATLARGVGHPLSYPLPVNKFFSPQREPVRWNRADQKVLLEHYKGDKAKGKMAWWLFRNIANDLQYIIKSRTDPFLLCLTLAFARIGCRVH